MNFKQWKNRKPIKEILEDKVISNDVAEQVSKVLENRKLSNDRMKNLAYWVKYNVEDDYLVRFDRLLKHPRNDSSSKEIYILRYGEKEGLKRFEEKSNNCAQTEENMIKRYGKEKGLKKWHEYKDKISYSNSEDGYIKKYGTKEGKERFKKQCDRNAGNLTLERKIELFGYEMGLEEYNKMKVTLKERHSLENYIILYGEEEGTEKYINLCKIRSYKNSLAYYIEKYGHKEGIRKIKEVKDNSSLDVLIEKYGEKLGYKKYIEFNKKKLNTMDNFVERYGLKHGLEKWNNFKEKTLKGYSEISLELFELLNIQGAKYGETEGLIDLDKDEFDILKQSIIKPDFLINGKIIEFFGDFWHGNPKIYKKDYLIPNTEYMASEKRKHDLLRIEILKSKGFDVKVVWESDYINDKEKIIEECLEFLNDD